VTERDALLKAVCDHPDDDTPRLVFADWLQEHGEDERAEFIRLQIQLHRRTYLPSEEEQLKRREAKLLWANRWKGDFPGAEQVRFSRGLVNHAHFFNAADFLNSLGRAPLRSVVIYGPVNLVTVIKAVSPHQIEEVDLRQADVGKTYITAFNEGEGLRIPGRLIIPWHLAADELWERVRARFGVQVQF